MRERDQPVVATHEDLRHPNIPFSAAIGLTEIRWHGRGGQGVVTAGELLAKAALAENKFFQSFPEFGAERTGAPVVAYTRVSNSPIYVNCAIAETDIVVVLDSTLLEVVDVFDGLRRGQESNGHPGLAVINSRFAASELRERFGLDNCELCVVDASRIAQESLGRNLPNSAALGALLLARELVSKETMVRVIKEHLGLHLPKELCLANVAAFNHGYEEADLLTIPAGS